MKNKIISHRGIYDNKIIFENTIESFKKAIKKNYAIELDIHITKDKKIIVFHDHNLKRLTGIDKIVEDTNYEDLSNNTLKIPTLDEVLNLVNGKVPILIELKQERKVGKLEEETMKILSKYKGIYLIQSFNPITLLWFKKNYPNTTRGQLSCKYKNKKVNPIYKFILKNMYLNFITKPNFISYKYNELSTKKIKKYQKKNIKVYSWTINNKEEYNKYKDLYDILICEKFI